MSANIENASLEHERIKSLKKYEILDTPPDGTFDRITKLAAILLDVPIAIVTLVDADRIWFKSKYGIDVQQIARDPGLCASAILSDDLFEVDDTRNDPRSLANPLVASDFGLRFYAAVPLKVKDGYNLGTLCILDKKPRQLSEDQKKILQYLGDITIDQIELRLSARTAIYQQNQVLSIAAHDLKNPLTTLTVWAELVKQAKNDPDAVEKIGERIKDTADKMTKLVSDLLESARKEASKIQIKFSVLNFSNVVEQVFMTNDVLAKNKNIQLHFKVHQQSVIKGDENRIAELADNLINNAIKYSPSGKNIFIELSRENNFAILRIKDEGLGLTEDDKNQLYQRFVKLSAKPTGGETSTGLGLSIVKAVVDAHYGYIIAESKGKNKGSTFTVKIPAIS